MHRNPVGNIVVAHSYRHQTVGHTAIDACLGPATVTTRLLFCKKKWSPTTGVTKFACVLMVLIKMTAREYNSCVRWMSWDMKRQAHGWRQVTSESRQTADSENTAELGRNYCHFPPLMGEKWRGATRMAIIEHDFLFFPGLTKKSSSESDEYHTKQWLSLSSLNSLWIILGSWDY